MKKRGKVKIIIKKGRVVKTKNGKFVISLSKKIFKKIKPFSRRIEVAGSIRRKEENPTDIDIVLIPKDREKIIQTMNSLGKFIRGGEKISSFAVDGVEVDLYYADEDNWGAMLISYTGPFGAEIGLRVIAKKRGLLLNQYGLFNKNKKNIASKTEKEIFRTLGKKYKKPEER